MKIEAIKSHRYGRAERRPGDVYEASPEHAKVLSAIGFARAFIPEKKTRQRDGLPATAATTPCDVENHDTEITTAALETSELPGRKRRYKRRDMTPEE